MSFDGPPEQAAERPPDEIDLLIERAWLDYDRERFDKALATFRQVINTVPITSDNRVLALQGAGASLRRLRRFMEAEEALAETLNADGTAPTKTLVERGWLYFYQQNYERAWVDFQAAVNRSDIQEEDKWRSLIGQLAVRQIEDATNADGHQSRSAGLLGTWLFDMPKVDALDIAYSSAKVHSYLNNYPPALIAINLALKFDPDNEKYLERKIETLKWLRRFEEAENTYLKAQQKFPRNIGLRSEIGHTYYEQKRFRDALNYFDVESLERFIPAGSEEDFANELKNAYEWTIVVLRKMYRFAEAEKKVEEALARFGDTPNLLSEKAVISFSKQEYEKAIKIFERVLKIDEYDEFALRWRAASYRKLGKYSEARECIREASERLPTTSWLCEEQAWLYFDQNDLKKADDCFAESIKIDAYLPRVQFSRVEVLARLNRNDDALKLLLQLRKQVPEDLEVAEQLGWFYLRRRELEHAREQFEFIKAKAPGNALGINGMGGYFLERRQYIGAEKAFCRAIKAVDYEPQYHINLAWALVRQVKEPSETRKSKSAITEKLLNEAMASCRKALDLDPYNATAFSCLGVVSFKKNRLLDAEGYFRQSLDLNPKGDSHVELGALYVQMGRYEEAKHEFSEAINVNRNDARAHIEMANLLLLTENTGEALQECRRAISIDPQSNEAHRALGIGLMRAGHYEEAETVLRKAINNNRNSEQWRLHLLLSQILIRRGDDNNKDQDFYKEALKHVNDAKRLNLPGNSDIYFHAGIVEYKLEDYRSAHRNFKQCLEINRERFEAERYGTLVNNMIREQRRVLRVNIWAGWGLAAICFAMLVALTTLYYRGTTRPVPELQLAAVKNENMQKVGGLPLEKVNLGGQSAGPGKQKEELIVDKSMLTFMTPILLGLLVVALLLPNLNKLKLPGGFEAEISEVKTKETISTGPKGEIGFGSSLPIISPGPGGR